MSDSETLAALLRVLTDLREFALYGLYMLKWAFFLAAIAMGYRMARG